MSEARKLWGFQKRTPNSVWGGGIHPIAKPDEHHFNIAKWMAASGVEPTLECLSDSVGESQFMGEVTSCNQHKVLQPRWASIGRISRKLAVPDHRGRPG